MEHTIHIDSIICNRPSIEQTGRVLSKLTYITHHCLNDSPSEYHFHFGTPSPKVVAVKIRKSFSQKSAHIVTIFNAYMLHTHTHSHAIPHSLFKHSAHSVPHTYPLAGARLESIQARQVLGTAAAVQEHVARRLHRPLALVPEHTRAQRRHRRLFAAPPRPRLAAQIGVDEFVAQRKRRRIEGGPGVRVEFDFLHGSFALCWEWRMGFCSCVQFFPTGRTGGCWEKFRARNFRY